MNKETALLSFSGSPQNLDEFRTFHTTKPFKIMTPHYHTIQPTKSFQHVLVTPKDF